jgi:hypothetical protein
MIGNQYVSFYVFYSEPWENLLIESIFPLLKKLFDDDLISQYFFIRYWEKGPHIRLRLKSKPEIKREQLSGIVLEKLNNFILKNPSKLFLSPEMEQQKTLESWHENNQIFSVKYQPEVLRYGGIEAISLAELQFFASSRIVLNELIENPGWTYDHALGAAIKLHLGFVFSIGMTIDLAIEFFRKNCRDWLPRPMKEEEGEVVRRKIMLQFENAYALQKKAILPYITGIWDELEKNPIGNGIPSWENWLSINQEVHTNLQLLLKNGILKIKDFELNTSQPETAIWGILGDFVHMTNNRLGIMNRDEGFLGFMLSEALKDLKNGYSFH